MHVKLKSKLKQLLFDIQINKLQVYYPTIIVIVISIVMVIGSNDITLLDQLLAKMVKDNLFDIPAIFNFTNKYFYLFGIIPVLTFVVLTILILLSQQNKRFKCQLIVFQLLIFLFYFIMSLIVNLTLKSSLDRPRPYQTNLYSNDTKVECKVEFVPFGQYNRNNNNPCNYHLHSCPSGHTQVVTTTLTGSLFMVSFVIKQLNEDSKQFLISTILWIYFYLIGLISIIFIPVTAIGRILASAHFFSDVSLGFILSFSVAGIFDIFNRKPYSEQQLQEMN